MKTSARSILFIAALALAMAACGEPEGELSAPPTPTMEVVEEHPCGEAQAEPMYAVIRSLTPESEIDGVSRGLDIDGKVTDSGLRSDWQSPDGDEGIDNQFTRLLPLIEQIGGEEALNSVVKRTIQNGGLLMMLEVDRLQDRQNDSCVEVELLRAKGTPVIGRDGEVESGQTFDRDPDQPSFEDKQATLKDGVLTAGPFDIELPMNIDTFQVKLTLRGATVRATIAEDGSVEGFISGSIVIQEVLELLREVPGGGRFERVLSTSLYNLADLERENGEGRYTQMSAVMQIEATPAFLFPPLEGEMNNDDDMTMMMEP